MRVALIGYAKEACFAKDVARGLGLFWQDRYTAATVGKMSVDESLRFFDWFAHDYRLEASEGAGHAGRRLIDVYREEVAETLSEQEAALLDGWIATPPGSAFALEAIDGTQGQVVLRDLVLPGRVVTAEDTAAAKHGEVGQILLARPLPEHDRVRLSGATVVLPGEEREGLLACVESAREAYVAAHPEATIEAFLRDRAYVLTHYALDWADREGRPAVAIEDKGRTDDPPARRVRRRVRRR
jgi:hypothetical protein